GSASRVPTGPLIGCSSCSRARAGRALLVPSLDSRRRSRMLAFVTDTLPLRVALLNDYEVVVRGLQAILQPHGDAVRVVELDVNEKVSQPVDLTLYDTFSQPQVDADQIDEVLANPHAGAVVIYSWN